MVGSRLKSPRHTQIILIYFQNNPFRRVDLQSNQWASHTNIGTSTILIVIFPLTPYNPILGTRSKLPVRRRIVNVQPTSRSIL